MSHSTQPCVTPNDSKKEGVKISVVIPCFNSSCTIGKLVNMTRLQLVDAGFDCEFILVNDYSSDDTFRIICNLAKENPNEIVAISHSKNFGQHNAIMAGLRFTSGDLIMLMDDDMQTHPSQCLSLINTLINEQRDAVFATWHKHRESFWRLAGSRFAKWSMAILTGRPKDVQPSNYLVMTKSIKNEVVRYKGPFVQIQGLIFRATSNVSNVEIEHFEREQGKSGYSFKALVKLWMTCLNFSLIPLRLASATGITLGCIGVVAAIIVVVRKALHPTLAIGWPSLMAVLLVCSGIILFFLGVLGEYLGRVFVSVNDEPQYVINHVVDKRPDHEITHYACSQFNQGDLEARRTD